MNILEFIGYVVVTVIGIGLLLHITGIVDIDIQFSLKKKR